jgi:hypothetical protein
MRRIAVVVALNLVAAAAYGFVAAQMGFFTHMGETLLLLYAFALVLILVPSLIVDQGDRYIEMALPLWAAAYALAVSDLLPDMFRIVAQWRRNPPQSLPLHGA